MENSLAGHRRPSSFACDDAGLLLPAGTRNKGEQYPADPPTIEEIGSVMRTVGAALTATGSCARALIVLFLARRTRDQRSARASRRATWTRGAPARGDAELEPRLSSAAWRVMSGGAAPRSRRLARTPAPRSRRSFAGPPWDPVRRLRRGRGRHPSQLGLSRGRQREGKVRPRGLGAVERLRDRRTEAPLLLARRAAHRRPPRRRRLRQQPLTQAGLTHARLAADDQDAPAPLRRSSQRSPGGRQLGITTDHRSRSGTGATAAGPSDHLVKASSLPPAVTRPPPAGVQTPDWRSAANDSQPRLCAHQ